MCDEYASRKGKEERLERKTQLCSTRGMCVCATSIGWFCGFSFHFRKTVDYCRHFVAHIPTGGVGNIDK